MLSRQSETHGTHLPYPCPEMQRQHHDYIRISLNGRIPLWSCRPPSQDIRRGQPLSRICPMSSMWLPEHRQRHIRLRLSVPHCQQLCVRRKHTPCCRRHRPHQCLWCIPPEPRRCRQTSRGCKPQTRCKSRSCRSPRRSR